MPNDTPKPPTRGERLDALRTLGTPRAACSDLLDSLDADGRARVDSVALSLRASTARMLELRAAKAVRA